jgi:hypothetical protein
VSQGKWEHKNPKKYPYLSINKHGIIGQHKTATTACRVAVKFEFGRVERWDRSPEDLTAEMEAAKAWWRKRRKENLASADAALSRRGKKDLNSPEMRKRRAAAVKYFETRKQFDKFSLTDDVFSLFKRLESKGSHSTNPQKIYGTYQGQNVFG